MWLWRVLHCIVHGTVRVFSIDTHMDMDAWAWTDMDMDIDMDMYWVLHLDNCCMAMLVPNG